MSQAANALRGEAEIRLAGENRRLRPSFAALVAAEAELGPLFALVERAGEGQLRIDEMAALIWHCMAERPEALTRAALGEALVAGGMAAAMPAVRQLMLQILQGR